MSYPPPGPYHYPATPPPAGPAAGRSGGRTLIWLGVFGLVAGIALIVAGAAVLATRSLSDVNDFGRVPIAQGAGSVTFSDGGNYVAYYEADDVTDSTNRVPLPLIQLRSPSGRVRTLDTLYGGRSRNSLRITTHLTYSYNGHHGVAIYQFRITETGTYDVAIGEAGFEAPGSDIAFGRSVGRGLAAGFGLLVPGIFLALSGLSLLVVGLVIRSQRSRNQGYGGPGHPQQPYPGQQFYPQQAYPQPPYPGQPPPYPGTGG